MPDHKNTLSMNVLLGDNCTDKNCRGLEHINKHYTNYIEDQIFQRN